MSRFIKKTPHTFILFILISLMSANAYALFGDDEARMAIIDLRSRVDTQRQHIEELQNQLKKLENAQRGQLELANQIEQLRQDLAKLRGQVETLAYTISETQKHQKELFTDIDNRVLKLEPQTIAIDGQEISVDKKEIQAFENALALFKNGEFNNAVGAFNNFQKTYPASAYNIQVQYWLGNSYYALRDYKQAIAQQQNLVKNAPQHNKAPDALLTVASSQLELNDKKSARKTLEMIIAKYPKSPAAITAKERLTHLK